MKFLLKQLIGKYFVIKESGQKVYIGKDHNINYYHIYTLLKITLAQKLLKSHISYKID